MLARKARGRLCASRPAQAKSSVNAGAKIAQLHTNDTRNSPTIARFLQHLRVIYSRATSITKLSSNVKRMFSLYQPSSGNAKR